MKVNHETRAGGTTSHDKIIAPQANRVGERALPFPLLSVTPAFASNPYESQREPVSEKTWFLVDVGGLF